MPQTHLRNTNFQIGTENGRLQTWNTNKTNALLVNEIKHGMKKGLFDCAKIVRQTNAQNKTMAEK